MFCLSQKDERWAKDTIGKTSLTLGRYGCTITSICMLFSKFYKKALYPNEVCKAWKFTEYGLILWNQTKFDGMRFIKRVDWYDKADMKKYINSKTHGVIVEVDDSHWLAARYFGTWPTMNDPWTGSVLWFWWLKYKKITGYAVFEIDSKN